MTRAHLPMGWREVTGAGQQGHGQLGREAEKTAAVHRRDERAAAPLLRMN